MLLQIFGKHGQKSRRRLNQFYAYVVKVEFMEFFFLNGNQLGNRARLLDASRTAADDYESHAFFPVFGCAIRFLGTLEFVNNVVANMLCLLQSFHAERVFLDILHPEKVSRRARRKNQIIVVNFAVIRNNYVTFLVDALNLRHIKIDISIVTEERTNRVGNFARLQNRSRYLIQKRLEQMEIMAVYKRNLDIFFGEKLTDFDTSKTAAYDYDMGLAVDHFKKPPEV